MNDQDFQQFVVMWVLILATVALFAKIWGWL